MTIDESNVFVQFISFPNCKTKEMVCKNDDDTFTIFLNQNLSHEAQLEAYKHALVHIEQDDFDKDDVQQIEAEAHNGTVQSTASTTYTSEQFLKRIRAERRKIEKKMQAYEDRLRYLEALGHYYKDPDLISGLDNY